ncbi:MAG: hypothetical protein ACRDQ4_20120 [Pseudonocardiaceae bacterium]
MEYTDATLDSLRLQGDPLADRVVADLVQSGEIGHVNQVLRVLCDNDTPIPEDLPSPLRDFLARTANLPEWADSVRIARAHGRTNSSSTMGRMSWR